MIQQNTIESAALLLQQSQISAVEQQQIEQTIAAIAQARNWNRDHAAQWLNQQASLDESHCNYLQWDSSSHRPRQAEAVSEKGWLIMPICSTGAQ